MIIQFLYKHFPSFRKDIITIAYQANNKPKDFSKLTMTFKDSKGKEYYGFPDPMDFPVDRLGQLFTHIDELKACMPGEDTDTFWEARDTALNRNVKGILQPDIAMLGFIQIEEKTRRTKIFHPEILLDLLACISIREDELPHTFDMEIHNQKKEQIRIDAKGHLFFFVHASGLRKYLPFLDISEKEWKRYFKNQSIEVEALNKLLKQYSTQKGLWKDRKVSESNSGSLPETATAN